MHDDDAFSIPSADRAFAEVDAKRRALPGGATASAAPTLAGMPMGGCATGGTTVAAGSPASPGFRPVGISTDDRVVVPEGYSVQVLNAWGDPVSTGPAFTPDASDTAAEQERQAGMHHDAVHRFPMMVNGPDGRPAPSSQRGLLVVNHEYTDDGLLHPDGMTTWTAAKAAKSQAGHGMSVVEVRLEGDRWSVVRPSRYGRRITANTPILVSGPAARDAVMKTADDASGRVVLGPIDNCAYGHTPWGTCLACEENFNGYFANGAPAIPANQQRYGITKAGFGYRWHEHDPHFDAAKSPNEPNRFGRVVEIDPWDPSSTPVKRRALGRLKHEGATVALAADGRVVVYMGDDERFEYIYKFVSEGRYAAGDRNANRDLLDRGTLYVARFDANGRGEWLPLAFGRGALTEASGFASQADVLIRARNAADATGGTKMDRPEWIAVSPVNGDVFCTLANNSQRGAPSRPATDAANPRADNVFGHVLRWSEDGRDAASLAFRWDILAQCGAPMLADAVHRHPAPRRARERTPRSRSSPGGVDLARRARRRPPSFRDDRDPPRRRRRRRHVIGIQGSEDRDQGSVAPAGPVAARSAP